jgi:hypothetical protein
VALVITCFSLVFTCFCTFQTLTNQTISQNGKKEINAELKKEAEFFRDIVIVPFMDSYDLVVLKTIAIAEYGVSELKYVR